MCCQGDSLRLSGHPSGCRSAVAAQALWTTERGTLPRTAGRPSTVGSISGRFLTSQARFDVQNLPLIDPHTAVAAIPAYGMRLSGQLGPEQVVVVASAARATIRHHDQLWWSGVSRQVGTDRRWQGVGRSAAGSRRPRPSGSTSHPHMQPESPICHTINNCPGIWNKLPSCGYASAAAGSRRRR